MNGTEEIISIVPQFNLDGLTRTTGDLFFTNKRIIFVKTAGKSDVTRAIFGMIGGAVVQSQSAGISKKLRNMPLDQLLASPYDKTIFAYTELKSMAIQPKRLLASRLILILRNGKKKSFWGKRRDLVPLLNAVNMLRVVGAPLYPA